MSTSSHKIKCANFLEQKIAVLLHTFENEFLLVKGVVSFEQLDLYCHVQFKNGCRSNL